MCQPRGRQWRGGICECVSSCCGCGCCFPFRQFMTAKEEEECLENYRDQLKKELEGVEEYIQKLKNR